MYEKFMLDEKSFQNVYDHGKITGFQLGVRVTHYHGIPLSLIGQFDLIIDGVKYGIEDMTFSVKGKTYTIPQCWETIDVRWDFAEVAIIEIQKEGGLAPGRHEVDFTQTLYAYQFATVNNFKTTLTLQSPIKRGVTLYSYQQEVYMGKLDLEGMIREVSKLDTDGVEILTEACIPDFPNPSDYFVYRWFEFMEKYKTKPVCYDSSFDGKNYVSRANGKEEALEKLKADIRLAKRLGFKQMRAQGPFELITAALPYAQENGINLGMEIHSPNVLDNEYTNRIIEYIQKTGTKSLSIIPDMGIFMKEPMRICYERHLRRGATPELVQYVCEAYKRQADRDQTIEEVRKMGGNELDLFWANEAFTFTWCDPKLLTGLVPYISHIHGKFYEMTEYGEEYSIPYGEAIEALKAGNWAGYICSEYEGQRHFHDLRYFEVDSVEEVRKHHEMLKKYIGM